MGWIKTLVLSFGVLCGFALFFALRIVYVQMKTSSTHFTPQRVSLTLEPPVGAVSAQITTIQGVVKKEGRQDTEFKTITKPETLVEGESLATSINGSLQLVFPEIVTLTFRRNTQIDYLNGLPDALVVRQPSGTVTYATSGPIKPFSVRSLALLTQWQDKAKITITTSTLDQTVTVLVTTGNVTVAYSDANNTTKAQKLTSGDTAVFDNTASTLSLE